MAHEDIIHGDCLSALARLPAESVDLVFADPPYNLQLQGALHRPNHSRVDGVEEAWDRIGDFPAYDRFTADWLTACRRVMKPDATIWVIGSYHNIFRVGAILQDLGFWILNDVIWRKTNPMPNFRGRRFTNAHETLIWAAHSKDSRHYFNHAAMRSVNEDLQMRSDWLIPLCTGIERLKLTDADGRARKAHPTQKPEALLHRVLLASSRPGDLVLDPFFGTGTTGAVARRLRRGFIGIDQDPAYVAQARARIAAIAPLDQDMVATAASKREQPRVPFGALIEQGLLTPGAILTDHRKRWSAKVRADGSLITGEHRGSIHQVGAAVQNLPACNGWTFWHIVRDGKLLPIDRLREEFLRGPAPLAAE